MIFKRVTPNSHYRDLRLLSEGGHWELGMTAYSHGMRMRMGHAGHPPRLMDFCMGRDTGLFPQVLVAVLRRLDRLAETASPEEIDAMFPWAGTRPNLSIHLSELGVGHFFFPPSSLRESHDRQAGPATGSFKGLHSGSNFRQQ